MKPTQIEKSPVEKLLLPEEVAEMMSLSRITVMRLAKTGRIPALKLGKVYRFSRAAIQEWLAAQTAVTVS